MITPRMYSPVSPAAVLAVALALAGCASAPSRSAPDGPARADAPPRLGVPFENYARDYVHVYLVGERREWLLGRVEPLARTRLRIPEAALVEPGSMRLVVLVGERVTLRTADAARATTTIAQPAASILSHRWTFSHSATAGQLSALRRGP